MKTGLIIIGECNFMAGVFERFFRSSINFEVSYRANCFESLEENIPDDFAGWIIFICYRTNKPNFSDIKSISSKKMPMIFYYPNSDVVDIYLPDKPLTQIIFQSPLQLEEFMLRSAPTLQ